MEITLEQKSFIVDAFGKLKTKEDLLLLLSYAKTIVYPDKAIPFSIKSLNFYSLAKSKYSSYHTFEIAKKSNGVRHIHAPVKGLKVFQKCISIILECIFSPIENVTGFRTDLSIVDNAKIHLGSNYVYNLDIKDFFPSIDQARVWACLQNPPFGLGGDRQRLASIIASICCTELNVERQDENGMIITVKRNVLPQGAPSSPILSNIICQRLDKRLKGAANRFGLKYSRYADDITFSSLHNVYQKGSEFHAELEKIILSQGFHINPSKSRLQKRGFKQEVTGLTINDKVNVSTHYIKRVRSWLYIWERYGHEEAQKLFSYDYARDKGHVKKTNPSLATVLLGKLNYLKMVKGREDPTFQKLSDRYKKLSGALPDVPQKKNKPSKSSMLAALEKARITSTPALAAVKSAKIYGKKVIDHDPTQIPSFINSFMNDGVLKYSTHFYDNHTDESFPHIIQPVFNYTLFYKEISERFLALAKQHTIPKSLYAKFSSFLIDHSAQPWSQKKIAYGWGHADIRKWCAQNKGHWPNCRPSVCRYEGFKISPSLQFGGQLFKTFNEVINEFKKGIQFRSNLKNELVDLLKDENFPIPEHKVCFDYTGMVNGVQFFSDVEKVLQAYRKIISVIEGLSEEKGQTQHVSFSLKEERDVHQNRKIIFELLHKDAVYQKSFASLEAQLSDGGGETINPIKKELLLSVCDWAIEAVFEDGSKKYIDILSRNPIVRESEQPEGVKHIFTFYRSNFKPDVLPH